MNRYNYLDILRNFANLIRCIIHAAVPYMVTKSPIWPVNDKGSYLFDFLIFENHLFVMELFFVISGFLFALSFEKNSLKQIIHNRFNKIIIPFVFGLLFIVPLVLSYFHLSKFQGIDLIKLENLTASIFHGINLASSNFYPTAHLWFLYYLILFYTLTILIKKHTYRLNKLNLYQLMFFSILISSTCMSFMDRWIVDNPLTLTIELPSFIHYYLFFLIGMILKNNTQLLNKLKAKSKTILLIGCGLGILAIIPQLWHNQIHLKNYILIETTAILSSCVSIYFITLGIWGTVSKQTIKNSKLLKYLTESSYWVYISNMPIVMFIHIILLSYNLNIFLKFSIALIGALTLSLISYEFIVRYTFIGALLNKKRKRQTYSTFSRQ